MDEFRLFSEAANHLSALVGLGLFVAVCVFWTQVFTNPSFARQSTCNTISEVTEAAGD